MLGTVYGLVYYHLLSPPKVRSFTPGGVVCRPALRLPLPDKHTHSTRQGIEPNDHIAMNTDSVILVCSWGHTCEQKMVDLLPFLFILCQRHAETGL